MTLEIELTFRLSIMEYSPSLGALQKQGCETVTASRIPRRERNRARNREDILAAALQVFAEKGFHDASIQEIAERAEFALGTLYSYFESKEELYRALLLQHAGRFAEVLNAALDQGADEFEKLRSYVRAKGEVYAAYLPMVRLYLSEARGIRISFKAGLDPDIKQLYERFLTRLAGVFRRGIEKGIFMNSAPYDLAVALDGMTNAFIYRWVEDPDHHAYPDKVDAIIRIFFGPILSEKQSYRLDERQALDPKGRQGTRI